jgi:hypothetical protein
MKKFILISIIILSMIKSLYGAELNEIIIKGKHKIILCDPPVQLLNVPDTRQSTDYSCGVASLQAVLMYWGIEYREGVLMELLHTTSKGGTEAENIVKVAQDMGLYAEMKENLTVKDLEDSIKEEVPVIIDIQAWKNDGEQNWDAVWEDGHYVVAIGFDEKNIYIEDPSLLGSLGFIPKKELLTRWHDYKGEPPVDNKDKKYIHMGIFIRGEKPSPPPSLLHID